jgi:hypothetical protein
MLTSQHLQALNSEVWDQLLPSSLPPLAALSATVDVVYSLAVWDGTLVFAPSNLTSILAHVLLTSKARK